MKGVIEKYIKNGGFGFILDEDYCERFFHISEIKNKERFLENINSYVLENNQRCCMVDFLPGSNEKGIIALNINLSDQILNDTQKSGTFKARIADFRYEVVKWTKTISGIKKNDSIPIFATAGGNGTYRIDYPEVIRQLHLEFYRLDDIGWGNINVRNIVLSLNNRSKITDKIVEKLKSKLTGMTIEICVKNDEWELVDNSILREQEK